ncbi:minor capsid protein [Lacrimispora celerecrescens]|uniref:SPP1 gp7 family putative phage head morphogenesis protein n=1 Tax=[Clostridium] celerecrescens 18A TaxID=1286362 RepID=A0A2M8ZAQ9_9FIRM|nr:minor capsid protein [Lacrimispora celerecrescens]PJJ30527.1 SPP1 gp7 family putative phage head morphogenesis protein [[Clostridium] celerecrescens 18A]
MAKKNSSYWKERMAALEDEQYSLSVAYYRDLEKQFDEASKLLQMDIERWYNRLADNNGVSYAKAKKMLKASELDEFKWTVQQYIKAGKENAVDQRWLKELENASARYHISRLEAMKLQIRQHAELLSTTYEGGTIGFLHNAYTENYYHTAFEIAKGTGVGSNLTRLDPKIIDTVIRKPWAQDGSSFSDRIWTNKEKLVTKLHTELSQSIIRGSDPKKAIRNLTQVMDVSRSQAGRLIMTESAAIASTAQKDCFKELGVEQYEILATLDTHTSDICRDMDEKVFDMKDYEVGVTAPPFHPHCRTTTVPHFDDEFSTVEMRAARDPVTGKSMEVPASMTYKQWHEEFVENDPQAALLEKMQKNEVADRNQFKDYKAVFGKDIPQSFAEFQNMKYTRIEEWERVKSEKQSRINQMDFSQMGGLKARLGNKEVRLWYKLQDEKIPDMVNKTQPLKEQAAQAFSLRNEHRTQARELMKDKKAREELDKAHKNPSFEQIMEHKKKKYGLTDEEAYQDIIRSSATTNKKYDRIAGVEGEEEKR